MAWLMCSVCRWCLWWLFSVLRRVLLLLLLVVVAYGRVCVVLRRVVLQIPLARSSICCWLRCVNERESLL